MIRMAAPSEVEKSYMPRLYHLLDHDAIVRFEERHFSDPTGLYYLGRHKIAAENIGSDDPPSIVK